MKGLAFKREYKINMTIKELLTITEKRGASDLHLIVSYPPMVRVNGELIAIPNYNNLIKEDIDQLIASVTTQIQLKFFYANKELDLSIASDSAFYRVNLYYQRSTPSAAFRLIPQQIRTIDELGLPKLLHEFTKLRQGLVLMTGPTGHGKTTTQAALINSINMEKSQHIITIEDTIEYVFPKGKSIVSQRELHTDTSSWRFALRAALREDPDVVLVGEMRDLETIQATITLAETGHLVFATLHTNTAAQSIERVVDVFPPSQQNQARAQLADILEGIVSQRLVLATQGGRVPATEILLATTAVRTAIRDGKTHQIDNIIQTSAEVGMHLLEISLANLVNNGTISLEVAKDWAYRPDELMRQLKRK